MSEINKIKNEELSNQENVLIRVAAFYFDSFFIFYIPWLIFTTFTFNPVINTIFFLCFYLFETFFGCTFGKFVFRLKVVDINGNKISFFRAIIRNLPKLIPLTLLFTNFKINDDQGFFNVWDIILYNIFPVILFIQVLLFSSYLFGVVFLKGIPLHDYFSKSQVIIATSKNRESVKTIGKFFGISFIIIQFLFFIAIPSFTQAQTRAKISSIKANMHRFQDMIENYALNHKGVYPETIKEFEADAKKEKYWRELKNPCDGSIEKIIKLKSVKFIKDNTFEQVISKGNLAYFINASKTKYRIYGAALIDNRAIKDKDKVFYLSNE